MRRKNFLIGIIVLFVIGLLFPAAVVLAGSLEPSGVPTAADSQMYTLDQIYNRINNGAAATKMNAFTEPSSGPTAGTMHTLDEIYELVGLRAPVAGTGQTSTAPLDPAPAGSDGALQKGVAWPVPRFTDNNNGTVTDNLTGLIWLKNANCGFFFSGDTIGGNTRPWAAALTAANSLASGSCDLSDGSTAGDWRLPNVREFQTLIHYGFFDPAVPNTAGTGKWSSGDPFIGVLGVDYWTSTSTARNSPPQAFRVELAFGRVVNDNKDSVYNVWPMRGR
jgi:hypothetical protein